MTIEFELPPCPLPDCKADPGIAGHHYHRTDGLIREHNIVGISDTCTESGAVASRCYSAARQPVPVSMTLTPRQVTVGMRIRVTRKYGYDEITTQEFTVTEKVDHLRVRTGTGRLLELPSSTSPVEVRIELLEDPRNRDAETVPAHHETPDVAELRRLAEGATKGPWFWWGNSDNHSIALCGRQPGLGVCEVISTVGVERSTTGREADRLRSDLAKYANMSLSDIEDAVQEWAFDEYDQPRIDQRLSVTDENHIRRTAEELAVYEVARAQGLPDDTPRDHERVYRADVCDLRATNARYIAAASPDVVLALLDRLAHMTEARDNARAEVERLVAAVREWADRRGVNVGDRDDDYMRGYRDAQRHAVQDAAELRAIVNADTLSHLREVAEVTAR